MKNRPVKRKLLYGPNPARELDPLKIGLGVMMMRGPDVLVHRRKGSLGDRTWSVPGGGYEEETDKSWKSGAIRELYEETHLVVHELSYAAVTREVYPKEGKQYITVFFKGIYTHECGEPVIVEPDKSEDLKWVRWNEFPRPLFLPIENLLRSGYHPF